MPEKTFILSEAEKSFYLSHSVASFLMIPDSWHKALQKETGKSYLLAEMVLSRLLFAYRPRPVEGRKGLFSHYFAGELYQVSYESLAEMLNQSKGQVKTAVLYLEEKGLIRRHLKTIVSHGVKLSNVLFISIDFEKVSAITDMKETAIEKNSEAKGAVSFVSVERPADRDLFSEGGVSIFRQTDTKEISDKPAIVPSVSTEPKACVKKTDRTDENKYQRRRKAVSFTFGPDVSRDILLSRHPEDTDRIEAILSFIAENGGKAVDTPEPKNFGESQELSLSEIEHVLDAFSHHDMTSVRNPKAYLYVSLLNAKSDVRLLRGRYEKPQAKAVYSNASYQTVSGDSLSLEQKILRKSGYMV